MILKTESAPFMQEDILRKMLTDADVLASEMPETDPFPITTGFKRQGRPCAISGRLKISAIAEGGGVKREAETVVPIEDGLHSLGCAYPFGRRDIDCKPPFSLCGITVNGCEITIAGETFTTKELPKTITKKLTAYGYGCVPWEEIIRITVCIN